MTNNEATVWEILVPTMHIDPKRPIKTRYHRIWDEKVRCITGGLTICHPAKGHWISPSGEVFVERMIPVRIIATKEQMEQIVDLTLDYYNQEAVLAYEIAHKFIFRHAAEKPKNNNK